MDAYHNGHFSNFMLAWVVCTSIFENWTCLASQIKISCSWDKYSSSESIVLNSTAVAEEVNMQRIRKNQPHHSFSKL